MKKLFILSSAAFLLFSSIARSQEVRFGATAGATFSNFHAEMGDESYTGKSKPGFTAGILVDIPMSKQFSFQPALNYVQKGSKDENTESGYTYKVKTTLNYLELPLNVLYNTRGSKGNFFIGAGPSLSIGLSGKSSEELAGEKSSEKIKFGNSDDDDLKSIDCGTNILAGYETKSGFLVSANYYHGLSNLMPDYTHESKFNNKYFGMKVGYMFGGKGKK